MVLYTGTYTMNILLVSDVYLPTISGVASSSDSIARFMASRGHRVTLVSPKPLNRFVPTPQNNLDFIFTPGIPDSLFVNKSMTLFPLGFGVLWKVFRSRSFDVVHIQEPGSLGVTAMLLAKIFRVPIVGAMHFSLPQIERVSPWFIRFLSVPFMKAYIRVIYHAYDAIMVPTKTAATDLAFLIGRSDCIHPISNGVDTAVYVPRNGSSARLRKKYGIPIDRVVFLYIGRLDADKNVETILRAVAALTTPYHLVIGGVGRQKQALMALADALGIAQTIAWFEGMRQQEIVELYQASDVFVIMSPVETQSIVSLQAIACGLPLVAANAGALPELVNGKNGVLVDTRDVMGLTRELESLAKNAPLRAAMGKQSRALSLAHHKQDVLTALERLYTHVIAARV